MLSGKWLVWGICVIQCIYVGYHGNVLLSCIEHTRSTTVAASSIFHLPSWLRYPFSPTLCTIIYIYICIYVCVHTYTYIWMKHIHIVLCVISCLGNETEYLQSSSGIQLVFLSCNTCITPDHNASCMMTMGPCFSMSGIMNSIVKYKKIVRLADLINSKSASLYWHGPLVLTCWRQSCVKSST